MMRIIVESPCLTAYHFTFEKRSNLKGQSHKMDKHCNQYFLCMRWLFSRSFKSFLLPYTIINFYLFLWKYLLILKMLTETLLRISFSVIGRCSLVPTSQSHWLQGKCARINLSPAAFGIILQNHRWLPVSIFSVKIAALWSLKRVTGRIFKISKSFQRSKLNFEFFFFIQVINKKL